jgi:hypothetical protein
VPGPQQDLLAIASLLLFIMAAQSNALSPAQHFFIISNIPEPIGHGPSDLVFSSFVFVSSALILVYLLAFCSSGCHVRRSHPDVLSS